MNTYQPGQRIALVSTNDPYTQLRPGDTGTVLRHEQAHHTVYIRWDNGSSLSMCLDAGDRIRPLPTPGSDQPAAQPSGWTVTLRLLRTRGTEAGRDVAEQWTHKSLAGLPAERATALRRHLRTGIDSGDPGVLAMLPTFSPPPRWGERDMAELRYTEAVHDSAYHLPADAASAPNWVELTDGQRVETIAASRDGFDTAVRERISELCREPDTAVDRPDIRTDDPDAGPF